MIQAVFIDYMGTTVAADRPTSPVPTPASTEARIYQTYSSIRIRSLRSTAPLWYHGTDEMSRMGRIPVRKKAWAALAAGAGIGAWCAHRDKKYPIRKELRFVNKLAVPGWAVNLETAKLANRALDRMALMPPALPQGVERFGIQFFAADGTPVRLTIYRPEGLDWAAPCLVYFHGGGFCVRDVGYIHRYAAQYAQGARCVVVFVHYRTADAAPFPTPFEDCYAALGWVWDNAPKLRLDRARIAVGGDSAGGTLAAACALRSRDEGGSKLCFQLLV